jgi:hypothetical protein
MGIDEGTGDTVRSDEIDSGPEGETEAGTAAEAGAVAASGDSDTQQGLAEDDAPKKGKKGKKKDLGVGTSRGIETMFRTNYRVHQDLVGIADAKANIMISVNGLIISIILGTVVPGLGASQTLRIPTGFLLVGCLIALVYAVLAATPRVSNIPITLEKIGRNEANILFFGHFVKLSPSDYQQGMRDLMENQDLLYFNMVRDLYGLGLILDRKFRLLRISYTVFMFALVLGVGLFVLAFAFPDLFV